MYYSRRSGLTQNLKFHAHICGEPFHDAHEVLDAVSTFQNAQRALPEEPPDYLRNPLP
jgi:hypothetical protein